MHEQSSSPHIDQDEPPIRDGATAPEAVPPDAVITAPAKNPVAVALGRRGGLKGGLARAALLTPEERRAIAVKAAQARWGPKPATAQESTAQDVGRRRVTQPAAAAGPHTSIVMEQAPPPEPLLAANRESPAAPGSIHVPSYPQGIPADDKQADDKQADDKHADDVQPIRAQASAGRREPSLAEWEALTNLPGTDGPGQLRLTDWRRRMADLYSEVRRRAQADPEEAWRLWCSVRALLYRRHPLSPVPADRRPGYAARHFPYDARLRFELPVRPDPHARGHTVGGPSNSLVLPNSGQEPLAFERVGRVEVPFAGEPGRLSLFWISGYAGGLFLPFRDATNGTETYGAGRYLLDTAKGADLGSGAAAGTIVVDFNFAFHPSCAFDPRWSCPLAPPENRLDIPIRAGERMT